MRRPTGRAQPLVGQVVRWWAPAAVGRCTSQPACYTHAAGITSRRGVMHAGPPACAGSCRQA